MTARRSRRVARYALPDACFDSLGLTRLLVADPLHPLKLRMRTRMSGGAVGARDRAP